MKWVYWRKAGTKYSLFLMNTLDPLIRILLGVIVSLNVNRFMERSERLCGPYTNFCFVFFLAVVTCLAPKICQWWNIMLIWRHIGSKVCDIEQCQKSPWLPQSIPSWWVQYYVAAKCQLSAVNARLSQKREEACIFEVSKATLMFKPSHFPSISLVPFSL